MTIQSDLVHQARALTKDKRKEIIDSFPETELHTYLKELFKSMQPDYTVEITHGISELGKDIVIVKEDRMTTDVVGVVVKRGTIKSKTLGDVDHIIENVNEVLSVKPNKKFKEIASQIRQAFEHPAELKTHFNALPVNKVFVVLAGDISNQARTRLAKEAKGPLEIFDMNWMIKNFTAYYPQVFFEGQVADFIQKQIQQLETQSWLIKSDKNLSECFVEPLVRNVDVPMKFDSASLSIMVARKKIPFLNLKAIASTSRRLILIGDPGTGKSAALAKLAIDLLRDAYSLITKTGPQRKGVRIPVLAIAKDIASVQNVDELLANYFGDTPIQKRVGVEMLMVDGLDEVPASLRETVVEKARQYADDLSAALIITSRKIDLLSTTPVGFEKYELLPFEASQALALFEKIHGKDQLLKSLKGGLDKIRYQIPMVPLSLIMLIELVEENKEIPASVTELYERFIDSVLGRYDRKKGIEVLFEHLVKKRFIAALAFSEFLSKGKLEIDLSDYVAFFEAYADEYGLDRASLERFVKEVERAGVLNLEETVMFSHRSFLDYFAAFHIYDRRDDFEDLDHFLVNIYFNEVWGDTAFFYIGLKRDISQRLLQKIFAYGEKESVSTYMDKFLSGRLLQAGWHSPTKTKVFGIEKAFGLVQQFKIELMEFANEKKWKLPKIFSDFFVLMLSDLSFRSMFVAKELQEVFTRICTQNIQAAVPILWAMKPFMSPNDLREAVDRLLEAVTSAASLRGEEKAKILLLLRVMEQRDKIMSKTIQKKINKLVTKQPDVFKQLLGPKQRGFRTPGRER